MRMDLGHRFDDMIDAAALGQEQVLGHGDRRGADFAVAFQLVQAFPVTLQALRSEEALVAAGMDGFIEEAVKVLLLVAAAAGDAFR